MTNYKVTLNFGYEGADIVHEVKAFSLFGALRDCSVEFSKDLRAAKEGKVTITVESV